MENREKWVLFDLDGTLTDPYIGITNSVKYSLAKMNIKIDPNDDLKQYIGPPLAYSFSNFAHAEDVDSAVKYYREYFRSKGIFENEMYEKTPYVLSELKKRGYKISLATSKPYEFAIEILKHFELDGYFDFFSANTLQETRPEKIDVISYALSECRINPSSCIMVGDRKYDISAAKQLGVIAIGVTFGYGTRKELCDSGAEFVVDSFDELLEVITKILG